MRRKSILSGLMMVMLSLSLALGASAKQVNNKQTGSKATTTETTTQSKTQTTTHPSAMHQSKKMKAEGTVVSSTSDKLEIKTASNGDETFVLNKSTKKPAQLAAGKEVRVWYRDRNGEKVASQVSVIHQKRAANSSHATTNSPTSATSPSASMKNQPSPKTNKPGY